MLVYLMQFNVYVLVINNHYEQPLFGNELCKDSLDSPLVHSKNNSECVWKDMNVNKGLKRYSFL